MYLLGDYVEEDDGFVVEVVGECVLCGIGKDVVDVGEYGELVDVFDGEFELLIYEYCVEWVDVVGGEILCGVEGDEL